ncbi:twin-arginine translocase subunit TatB [Halioglobus maricola]|uniref:Sec-independent protein translocase protein TatB n=1 Tax=Halioglobus maricola TaxID=2601894 RepID=A0A5P9NNT8_9GAMM|nr:Sec-independent protein translocase protein TatB [Halioglobus maricola]QFU77533.1 twin-arginine translocase subunit TatB [Halioglobus maricola]
MFDIGFTELVIVAIVGLLVIGPERLPGAIRTGSAWLGRIKRGFSDIKREVEQELHNDGVMQELKKTQQQLSDEASGLAKNVQRAAEDLNPLSEPEDQAGAARKAGPDNTADKAE